MSARTGAQYLSGLRDNRSVWVNGEAVRDLTSHELFKGSLAGMAGYFDWQNDHADACLMEHEGGVASVSHLIPRCREDLARRHECLHTLAKYSVGMLGRTPDYLNVTFAGFAGQPSIWRQAGNERWQENLCAFQKEMAAKDLALTHTIVHPVLDKRIPDYEGVNGQLALRKVDETADSIVVSGARILATLGPFADELAVYPGHPIPEDQPDVAIAFSVPMDAPGLKVLCRDHYGVSGNVFDHPFSSRFDEQDAFIVFDQVEVPKHRVFCNANPTVFNTAMRNGWTGNIMQQTVIRALVKLEFAYDLANRIAKVTGQQKRGEVTHMLGELWSYAELTRAALKAAEDGASDYGDGTWICDETTVLRLAPHHARLDGPGERHPQDARLAQPAGHAGQRRLRRRSAQALAGDLPWRRRRHPGRRTRPPVPHGLGHGGLRPRRPDGTLRALLSGLCAEKLRARAHARPANR